MSSEHQDIAHLVAGFLAAGERSIDSAVADVSRLSGHIATARIEARMPFGNGQGAMDDVVKVLEFMMRARHHMARAHDRLREAGETLGVEVTAFGDVVPCPVASAEPAAPAHIRLVA